MSAVPTSLTAALADRYRIERELGAGGMATVFLAQDLKHDRQVALKVLKPELAAVLGAERFVVEIKTTAALQHPHILPLFDSGTADSFLYYVMPYIQGETLRSKLDRETQLGIDEAVKITVAVADALDYAHRQGVIHRDIKPENILLHDGRPMVADFGIALALSAAAGGRMTETGLSLGTPHYMSPEQATAEKEITGRSDIYSLGSVLYEMLTGNPPHTGASAQQIIMKIVTEEAAPVTRLRKSVPPNVAAAVAKSLEKLPADRFASAAEFAAALQNSAFTTTAADGTVAGAMARPWHKDRRTLALLGVLAVMATALGISVAGPRGLSSGSERAEPVQFTFTPPTGYTFGTTWIDLAVSPDGRLVAFQARGEGTTRLFLRRMDGLDATPLITMPGDNPALIFSPDGRWIAFLQGTVILRVPVTGGTPAPVGNAPVWVGTLAWPAADTIVTRGQGDGLSAVSVRTGAVTVLTTPDSARGELAHHTPVVVLPDGRWAFTVVTRAGPRPAVLAPDRHSWTYLSAEVQGRLRGFVTGHLVVERPSGTVTVPVDAAGSPSGDPVALEPAGVTVWVAPAGTLVAAPGSRIAKVEWVDKPGNRSPLPLGPGNYVWPRLSPDGRRLSVAGLVADLATGRAITRSGGLGEAVWTPDGTSLTGRVEIEGRFHPAQQRADGSTSPQLLEGNGQDLFPTSWSPDGRFLLAYALDPATGGSADVVVREPDGKWRPLVTGPGNQRAGMFSPDGRWVAYMSDESGRPEVYLRDWPGATRRWIVSSGGGADPVWSGNGRELYYLAGNRVMAVSVQTGSEPILSAPQRRFEGQFQVRGTGDQSYDVAKDGRLLMLFPALADADQVKVTLNWLPAARP